MEQTTYILPDGTTVGSWTDFGLRKTARTKITPPKRKRNIADVLGANGNVNLMRNFPAVYEARTLTDTFALPKRYRFWEQIKSEIYQKLNFTECRIILDRDPCFYWLGPVEVTDISDGRDVLTLKVTATVFPYKYERFSSVEDWLWDPFDFRFGVIRDYRGIAVNSSTTLTIPCQDLDVIPGFWTSSPGMGVSFNGVSAALTQRSASENPKTYEQFGGIVLPGGGERMLTLTGSGTVDVLYRGGIL